MGIILLLSGEKDFSCCCAITGGYTPVCALSSLRDFRVSPHELLLSRKPNYRRINRGALDFPRTAIKLYRMVWQVLLSAEEGLYAGTHRRQDSLSTYTKAAEHLYKGG